MNKSKVSTFAAVLVSLAFAPLAFAQKDAGKATASPADKAFMTKAAVDGMAEVELGKIAQQKGANAEVKAFATRMVDDHSKAGDELKGIAGAKGVTLPGAPDAKHKADMAKMQKLSGADFDRQYMDHMVMDHDKAVAEFRKASQSKDADVAAFARKTLPTLEEHQKMAKSTQAAVRGTGGSASGSGGATTAGTTATGGKMPPQSETDSKNSTSLPTGADKKNPSNTSK
jgi:putative membrane protein